MPVRETLNEIKSKLTALLTYANSVTGAEDTSVGDAIETLASASNIPHLVLLDEWTGYLDEYTGTENETIETDIRTGDYDDIYLLITIECDGAYNPPLTREWSGFSICLGGLYENRHTYNHGTIFDYRGVVRPTQHSELASGVQINHGIKMVNNTDIITFQRQAHATNCPRVMGGNYTVKVYAIKVS